MNEWLNNDWVNWLIEWWMNEWMNDWLINWLIDWLIEKIHIYLYISFSDGTNNILLHILLCSITKYEWMNINHTLNTILNTYQTHT